MNQKLEVLNLMGHTRYIGVLRQSKKYGMSFIEVFLPKYTWISKTSKIGSTQTECFMKLVSFESAGYFAYKSIHSIEPSDEKIEKYKIENIYEDDLPF